MDPYWMVVAVTSVTGATAVLLAVFKAGSDRSRDRIAPEQLLAQRFAAGEIDEREYLTRLSILDEARQLSK